MAANEKGRQLDAIKALRSIKEWGPLLAGIGVALGAYYEARYAISDLRREQAALSERIAQSAAHERDLHALGPGGLSHPSMRLGIEEQIRSYMAAHGCKCEEYWASFFALNPTLAKPPTGR